MPPRSPKMNRRIFGFQRRVWWPKWTPASSSSRMVTADTRNPPDRFGVNFRRRRSGVPRVAGHRRRAVRAAGSREVENRPDDSGLELPGRPRAASRSGGSGAETSICSPVIGVGEGELGGVQELALEAELGAMAVHAVADDRMADRRHVDADLVRPAGLERHAQERPLRRASTSSKCVTASRGALGVERLPRAARAGRARSRPRSARSATAAARARAPGTSRRIRRRRSWAWSRRSVSSSRATSRRPDVSRSRRWTIPARPGGATRRRAGERRGQRRPGVARDGVHEQSRRLHRRPAGGRRRTRPRRPRPGAAPAAARGP